MITQLRPSVRQLGPTLTSTAKLATELQGFYPGLRAAINAAPKGFPALRRLLDDDLPPLLTRLPSFLDELTPIITVDPPVPPRGHRLPRQRRRGHQRDQRRGRRRRSTTCARWPRSAPRCSPPIRDRLASNRTNPYIKPKGYLQPAERPGVVRDRAVHERDQLDPRSERRLEPGLQLAHRRRRRRCPGPARPDPASSSSSTRRSRTMCRSRRCNKQAAQASIGGAFEEFSDYLHVRALP